MLYGLPHQHQGSMNSSFDSNPTAHRPPDIRVLYGVERPPQDIAPPELDIDGMYGQIMQMLQTLMQLFARFSGRFGGGASSVGGTGKASPAVAGGGAPPAIKSYAPSPPPTKSTAPQGAVAAPSQAEPASPQTATPVNAAAVDHDVDKPLSFDGEYNAPRGKVFPTGNVKNAGYTNPVKDPSGAQSTPVTSAFTIDGSPEWKSRVIDALNQLKTDSPDYYKMVYSYVAGFKEVPSDPGINSSEDNPVYKITFPETKDNAWLKSIIVHEAWHVVQEREGLFGERKEPADNRAQNAQDIQFDYLESIGEAKHAQYVLNADGSHWRK